MAHGPILVTGATGFAGGHLLDRLARGGSTVVGWAHAGGRIAPATRPHVTWQAVDLLQRDRVMRAIADLRPSRVYHLAGASHVGDSWHRTVEHLQVNALATAYLLDAICDARVPCRVLVATSALLYEAPRDETAINESAPLRPSSPYGFSKLAQDDLARRAVVDDGLDVAIARPFNHIGPGQAPTFAVSSFARQIAIAEAGRAPAVLRVGNLDARRDMTDVRDVVAAYERVMTAAPAGRPFNVCRGEAYRIGDVLERLLRLARVPVQVVFDQTRARPSDTPVVLGDPSRIRQELGWQPSIDLDDTLRDTLEWWRANADAA